MRPIKTLGRYPPRRKRGPRTLKTHIYKVLKQVHPDQGLSKYAMCVVDNLIMESAEKIINEMQHLMEMNKKTTLTSREVQTAVRLTLPGEIAKHAVAEGTKAVSKYCMNTKGRKSEKAGLQFSVSFFRAMLKAKLRTRVGATSPVYLAAVLEYISAEVLELAGNAAKDNRNRRITPRHVLLAIRSDQELDTLWDGTIRDGGVVPHIHAFLVAK